ncbi:hypothetical protein ANO11243_067600 [Dothideomycetidae sp. 11243]|nr:hypothetical protein ANO11243_067600 [fungal sp. No.11243]
MSTQPCYGNLWQLLETNEMKWCRKIATAGQISTALQYSDAQSHLKVHIKPANVLYIADGSFDKPNARTGIERLSASTFLQEESETISTLISGTADNEQQRADGDMPVDLNAPRRIHVGQRTTDSADAHLGLLVAQRAQIPYAFGGRSTNPDSAEACHPVAEAGSRNLHGVPQAPKKRALSKSLTCVVYHARCRGRQAPRQQVPTQACP